MTALDAYRHVAAMATLDKWYSLRRGRKALKAKAAGLVWHDRYLCGDAERGRRWHGRQDA